MKSNNKDIEEYLLNILYSLDGKINKSDFNKIKRFFNWDFNFKSIHIVGTNGKGSNAKYINDELIAQGYKVGLFTSPHISQIYERIKVNNIEITFESMLKFISTLKSNFVDINFGWFDVFFLCAIHWFHTNHVDVAIFEAGIGARKDIVNYINHNYLLITSINLDHEEILGNTIEKIASDKSFAIKNNVITYISDAIDQKALEILEKKAQKELTKFYIVKTQKDSFETINQSLSKTFLKNEFSISDFKSLFLLPKARVEKIKINDIDCYIDVAHNIESFQATFNYFQLHNIKFDQILVSLSKDKNYEEILKILDTKCQNIFVYENHGRKPLKLHLYGSKYQRIVNLESFIKKISTKTLFIGSFYLVSEVLDLLKGGNYNNK